ncbi:MAG: hypothetical protein QOD98_1319, partial [Nocardioidaceae bacterium]|nr:hypothetical protein [Nocardioidaceae bacterium]
TGRERGVPTCPSHVVLQSGVRAVGGRATAFHGSAVPWAYPFGWPCNRSAIFLGGAWFASVERG